MSSEEDTEQVCGVHSERLRLFCLTDRQPVCVVCRDSAAHRNHSCKPVEEVMKDLREKLRKCLEPLTENLQKTKDLQEKFEEQADRMKNQFHQTERRIQAEFKKLHQFLVEEEESRMKALREEEEQKTQRMKDKMAAVSREIEALTESIRATEEQLRAPDVSFLLRYKAAVERVQRCPLLEEEPQLGPEALIDQAKHLGNLTFNIWTNMKRLVQFTPVILDPSLMEDEVLSDDLTSCRFKEKKADQESPQNGAGVVYGSEGFDSGSHSWDVEVEVTADPFEEGVKKEDDETWFMRFSDGKYEVVNNDYGFYRELVSKPQKIRVCLDFDKREVSFHDLDSNAHIHTIAQISRKKLRLMFFCKGKYPIRILPQKI